MTSLWLDGHDFLFRWRIGPDGMVDEDTAEDTYRDYGLKTEEPAVPAIIHWHTVRDVRGYADGHPRTGCGLLDSTGALKLSSERKKGTLLLQIHIQSANWRAKHKGIGRKGRNGASGLACAAFTWSEWIVDDLPGYVPCPPPARFLAILWLVPPSARCPATWRSLATGPPSVRPMGRPSTTHRLSLALPSIPIPRRWLITWAAGLPRSAEKPGDMRVLSSFLESHRVPWADDDERLALPVYAAHRGVVSLHRPLLAARNRTHADDPHIVPPRRAQDPGPPLVLLHLNGRCRLLFVPEACCSATCPPSPRVRTSLMAVREGSRPDLARHVIGARCGRRSSLPLGLPPRSIYSYTRRWAWIWRQGRRYVRCRWCRPEWSTGTGDV
ncbi:hypothetical protein DFH09DRAFT_1318543 [Mycena vulgaris]|nr:hypothetical protein DFH09DRAFT_1318543 [Mycena vulgaris]